MFIIDTHSHIYDESFDHDVDTVIDRAKKSGVRNILLPNIDVETIDRTNGLAHRYSGYCLPMMGLHPSSVSGNWKQDLDTIKKQFALNNYIAVGEIGIDLHWDKTYAEEQKLAFKEQLKWSLEFDLPVSIHSRDAILECVECIQQVGANKLRGVFHSFGGNEEELKSVLNLENFYLGINGTVTYKNSILPSVLKNTNLEHLVIETDAPYLPPVPFRGKRNEPSYTTHIVQKLADIYTISIEEIANTTSSNAKKMFGIE